MPRKGKTLTQRVEALERTQRAGIVTALERDIQGLIKQEREMMTGDVMYGRIAKELQRMERDLYDRLVHHRVTVTVHHDINGEETTA